VLGWTPEEGHETRQGLRRLDHRTWLWCGAIEIMGGDRVSVTSCLDTAAVQVPRVYHSRIQGPCTWFTDHLQRRSLCNASDTSVQHSHNHRPFSSLTYHLQRRSLCNAMQPHVPRQVRRLRYGRVTSVIRMVLTHCHGRCRGGWAGQEERDSMPKGGGGCSGGLSWRLYSLVLASYGLRSQSRGRPASDVLRG
jgi:hypothetical protein